MDFYKDCHWRD